MDVLDLYLLAKAVRVEPGRFFGLIAARIDALEEGGGGLLPRSPDGE